MKALVLAFFVVVLAACGDPRDTALPTDLAKLDDAIKEPLKKLNDEEKQFLIGYVVQRQMATGLGKAFGTATDLPPPAATIREAIAQQRTALDRELKLQAEAKALKDKLKAEQAAVRKSISDAVTATVVELKVLPKNYDRQRYSDVQEIKLGFENKSGRDIAGIKGAMHFVDMFDSTISRVRFSYSDGIAAGKTATWTGERDINMFSKEHKALASAEEGKYKAIFEPEVVIFKDGAKLTMPAID